jgi:hypothetical protein
MGGFGGVTGGEVRLTLIFGGSVATTARTGFFFSGSLFLVVRILLW